MNRSDEPAKQPVPFGVNGQREVIEPDTTLGDNSASYNLGFPPITMILKAAGGLPPKGQDMNQILFELSALSRWFSTGAIASYDSTFSTAIGGYPKGAEVLGSDLVTRYFNTVDANTSNPNTGGAGWFNLTTGYLKTANNLSDLASPQTALTNLGGIGLSQLTGVVGTSRNAKMSIAAASATATFTADELIVQTALGGLQYKLSSFSKTINLATTGAGGMDTGTVPATGFVALYAIYNPTTQVSALLAVNATSVRATEVYTGANMPTGYTASALVSVSPISSSQFKPSYLVGRDVSFQNIQVVSASATMPALIRTSIASAAPLNALSVRGGLTAGGASAAASSYVSMTVATDVLGCGKQEARLGLYSPNGSDCSGTFNLDITDPQGVYYRFDTDMTSRIGTVYIVSYSF
ncbi:hypothetical protein V1956_15330 [Yersinia sp. 2540 StPb PI]|uniref:hypothetical protein n=1 Tax=Yersinia sp. 2540 StPb PI TaxID=3117406 RepID=UPI003FA4D1A6